MTTTTGHCICGSSYRITSDVRTADGAARLWWQVHTGPGHGPATPDQCRAARIAAQRSQKDSRPCQQDDSSQRP
jgi:hypothetical protein